MISIAPSLKSGSIADSDAWLRRLAEIAERHDVLRIKGFAEVRGKPMRLLVQGVGNRFQKSFDRPWRAGEPRQGRLVVIGEKGFDKASIARLLAARTADPCTSCARNRDRSTRPKPRSISDRPRRDILFLSFSDSDLSLVAARCAKPRRMMP